MYVNWLITFFVAKLLTETNDIYLLRRLDKKEPNQVCSFLKQYIARVSMKNNELYVYADNCGGQNNNYVIPRLFLA
jgi:hypothetical protein